MKIVVERFVRRLTQKQDVYVHEPMKSHGLAACLVYLLQAEAHYESPKTIPMPGAELLTQGLPQGAIREAEVREDPIDQSAMIAMVVKGRVTRSKAKETAGPNASPRLFDPEGFLVVRLLLLFGNTIFLDSSSPADMPAENKRFYLEFFGRGNGITALRIIADAQRGEEVPEARDHHDLRRKSLRKQVRAGKLYRGREEAIREALRTFDRPNARMPLKMERAFYELLLRRAFVLLDKKPLLKTLEELPLAAE